MHVTWFPYISPTGNSVDMAIFYTNKSNCLIQNESLFIFFHYFHYLVYYLVSLFVIHLYLDQKLM